MKKTSISLLSIFKNKHYMINVFLFVLFLFVFFAVGERAYADSHICRNSNNVIVSGVPSQPGPGSTGYYCSGNEVGWGYMVGNISCADSSYCQYGCSAGACLAPPPPPPTCTSFTYSAWGTCTLSDGVWQQTRTITSSSPSGCTGGSSESLSQSCVPACTSWSYSDWTTCLNGIQTRTVYEYPIGCSGGVPPPATSQSCTAYSVITAFSISPNPVPYKGSSITRVSWDSSGSSYCIMNGAVYSGGSGHVDVSLTQTTPFTLTCYNSASIPSYYSWNNTAFFSPLVPITINLNANPLTVITGNSSIISMDQIGADSCTVTKNGSPFSINNFEYLSQFSISGLVAIAPDSSGNIYVGEGSTIKKYNSSGVLLSQFSVSGSTAIALDSYGDIYVGNGSTIKKYNSSGVLLSQFGSVGTGDGQFSSLNGIAIDSSNNIYVADSGNNRVQKFDSSGNLISKFGSNGSDNGQFQNLSRTPLASCTKVGASSGYYLYPPCWPITLSPSGLAIDSSGNIYVADAGNNRVQKFDSSGNYISQFGSVGSDNGQFNGPYGIAIDSSNNIYVTDTNNFRVQKFDSSGNLISKFGSNGSDNGQFGYIPGFISRMYRLTVGAYSPHGIAIDSSNNIYVVDDTNYRIQKFQNNYKSSGNISTTTTFVAQCENYSNLITQSATVNVQTNPIPTIYLRVHVPEIKWDVIDAYTCTLKEGDDIISQTATSGIIVNYTLMTGIEFTLNCTGPGGSASKSVVSVLPTISSVCAPSQGTSTEMYVNRNTKWTITNASGTVASTIWNGTDILSEITTLGSELDKIYTTVGTKSINAAATITVAGTSTVFTSYCSTSTIMKLDEGTGGEI